jgi:hypothetical protein
MQNRFRSPVVWGATVAVVGAQLVALSQTVPLTGWSIAIAVTTVVVAFFAALNNPENKDGV